MISMSLLLHICKKTLYILSNLKNQCAWRIEDIKQNLHTRLCWYCFELAWLWTRSNFPWQAIKLDFLVNQQFLFTEESQGSSQPRKDGHLELKQITIVPRAEMQNMKVPKPKCTCINKCLERRISKFIIIAIQLARSNLTLRMQTAKLGCKFTSIRVPANSVKGNVRGE